MADYYTPTSDPADNTDAEPAVLRAEHTSIGVGFTKVAPYTGNAGKIVAINSAGTAQEAITTTGTGSGVRATSPTLVTPVLGVATATSINKVAITAPATSATLTIADGKTLTASNTLTLAGTDGSTLNIGAGGTLGTAATQNTGTSGATIPLLNANALHTGHETFQGRLNVADTVGGTVNAITATHVPAFTAWTDKMRGVFRATGANTSTTPTFAPDGLAAKTIVKENLAALAANDISGAGHEVEWIYNATADKVVLLNPKGGAAAATQAEMEAASSTAVMVTPGRAQYHPSAAKAWAKVTYSAGVPALTGSYNCASVADDGTGLWTITFTTPFSSTDFAVIPGGFKSAGGANGDIIVTNQTVNVVQVQVRLDGIASDATSFICCFGDQ